MGVWSYPPTRKQLAVTAFCFVAGIGLFAVGAHLSLANVGPQQERVKARREFVKDRLRKLLDDEEFSPKLLPLASEFPVWRLGQKLLPSVHETTVGRIGGLVCWDNKMPDLRTQLYAKGIELYCAPTAEAREIWCSSMVHIALEGDCFIPSANQFCRRNDDPLPLDSVPGDSNDATSLDVICAGGSVIVSPSGTILAGPNYQGESLISADQDLGEIDRAKLEFGEVEHNAEDYTVGWSTNRSNPELFTTTMKTEVSEAPYGLGQDCFTTIVKTEVADDPNELLL